MSGWVGIGRSDVGLVRSSNQDAFVTADHLGFWAVADGMGGHPGGDVAAHTAIASATSRAELFADALRNGQCAPQEFLNDLLLHAQEAILGRAQLEPRLKHMGTTIVSLLILPDPTPTAHLAHLGDSRAYLYRSGILTALTRDHTLMEKYLERGILTEASARTHPERHVLTRALGMPTPVRPTFSSHALREDDLLMLCSDGLTKMLEDLDIGAVLAKADGDPIRACDQLLAEALAQGGEDNVTVIVIARP
jgi:protein phosphatase